MKENRIEENWYHVVLEFNATSGEYAGLRCRTAFTSREKFEKWYEKRKDKQTIIAEGITEDEASRLATRKSHNSFQYEDINGNLNSSTQDNMKNIERKFKNFISQKFFRSS
jgi:hypothetical protein